MDFVEDYLTNNITIQDLNKKYNISERHIRKVFKARGINTKHKNTKKKSVYVDKIFKTFLEDFLNEGMSMKYYADKYKVTTHALTKRLNEHFKLRKINMQ
jgi:hypothetical protein